MVDSNQDMWGMSLRHQPPPNNHDSSQQPVEVILNDAVNDDDDEGDVYKRLLQNSGNDR